tara:strand:+ start:6105 stop:6725 length:621 start_codon:yes stop_codon:yes gene_type:complete
MARTVINVTPSANLDGRDISVDGAKLDTIESNATADQTAAEIRALVASATNSNVFTDAQVSKLAGIEDEATAGGGGGGTGASITVLKSPPATSHILPAGFVIGPNNLTFSGTYQIPSGDANVLHVSEADTIANSEVLKQEAVDRTVSTDGEVFYDELLIGDAATFTIASGGEVHGVFPPLAAGAVAASTGADGFRTLAALYAHGAI